MDYNTTRDKLIMPEYGRHIQKMVEQVKEIPDKEKRMKTLREIQKQEDLRINGVG